MISSGINQHVSELPEENEKPIHYYEDVTLGAVKPVATKQHEQFIPFSSSSSSTCTPIDQREWNDILAVGNIDEESFKIPKKMTRLPRHHGHLPEMMEQLGGEGCCLCPVVITLAHRNGRMWIDLVLHNLRSQVLCRPTGNFLGLPDDVVNVSFTIRGNRHNTTQERVCQQF